MFFGRKFPEIYFYFIFASVPLGGRFAIFSAVLSVRCDNGRWFFGGELLFWRGTGEINGGKIVSKQTGRNIDFVR